VDLGDVRLHPADMRGAIVSLSRPLPAESWRWGGPQWQERSAPLRVAGATIGVADLAAVAARWETVLGAPLAPAGIRFEADAQERGLLEVVLAGPDDAQVRGPLEIGGVRFVFETEEEKR